MKDKIFLKKFPSIFLYFIYIALLPSSAFAVQTHGGPEGLVSHQLGHILFIVGTVSILSRIYYRHLRGPGWQEFKGFLWLLLLWNCLTFSGHWMRELVNPEKLIKVDNHIVDFRATTTLDLIFYLTRLDHLVLVPAFLLLFISLMRWEQAS